MANKRYHYFVEGECEEKFINIFKKPKYRFILAGKVEVLNVVNEYISKNRLLLLSKGTVIILLYDTDVKKTNCLERNIELLKENGFDKIYHVHSVEDFEDELLYACSLKSINKLYDNCHTKAEFKSRFLKDSENSIVNRINKCGYENNKMWSRNGRGIFASYDTKDGSKIIKV